MSFDGATGKVAFDEFGDTTTKVLTVYKVEGGKWVADKTGRVQVAAVVMLLSITGSTDVQLDRGQAAVCPQLIRVCVSASLSEEVCVDCSSSSWSTGCRSGPSTR